MARRRVSENAPVQVYLGRADQARIDRLAQELELTKSDVVRRGLLALERELLDPASHPALKLIGIASGDPKTEARLDAAREHDRVLAISEEATWLKTPRKRRGRTR